MSDFKFVCGRCGQHLRIETNRSGDAIKCPACGAEIRAPSPNNFGPEGLPVAPELSATLQATPSPASLSVSEPVPEELPPAPAPPKRAVPLPLLLGAGGLLLILLAAAAIYFLPKRSGKEAAGGTVLPPEPSRALARQEPGKGPPPEAPAAPAASEGVPYAPPAAEFLAILRVGDIWQAPLVQKLLERSGPQAKQFQVMFRQMTGLDIADIESVALAATNLAAIAESAGGGSWSGAGGIGMNLGGAAEGLDAGLAVVRTRKPYNPDQVAGLMDLAMRHEKVELAGKPCHRLTFTNNPVPLAVCFADPQTILLGAEEDLKAALARGPKPGAPPPSAEALGRECQLVVALAPAAETLRQFREGSTPATNRLQRLLDEQVVGGAFGLQATDTLAARALLTCKEEAGAREVAAALQEQLNQARQGFAGMAAMLPPPLFAALQETLNSLSAAAAGAEVKLSLRLAPSLFDPQVVEAIKQMGGSMTFQGGGQSGFR